MALSNNVKIALNIEVAKSTKDIEKLQEATDELSKSLENVAADSKEYADIQEALAVATQRQNELFVENAINTSKSAKTIQEMTKSLKALKTSQELVDKSSPQFKELQQAINDTEGRIGDLNDSFRTLTGSGLERFNSSIGLVKEGIGNLDWEKVKIGVKGTTQAFGGLKAALGALGIGLIIQAVTYLIENFDELKNSTGLLGTILRKIGDLISMVGDALEWLADKLGIIDLEQEKRLENAQKAVESEKMAQKATEQRYDTEIAYAKAAGKDVKKLEEEKLNAVEASLRKQIEGIKQLAAINGQFTDEQRKQYSELSGELVKNIQEQGIAQVKSIKERSDATIKAMIEDAKKKEQERENNKKLQEKILNDTKVRIKAQLDELRKTNELELIGVDKTSQKYIDIKEKQFKAETEFITKNQKMLGMSDLDVELFKRKNAEETTNLKIALAQRELDEQKRLAEEEKKRIEEIRANNKAVEDKAITDLLTQSEAKVAIEMQGSQAKMDAEVALLETRRQLELQNEELTAEEKLAINMKYDEQVRQLELQRVQDNLAIAQSGFSALQGLSDAYFSIQEANTAADGERAEKLAKKKFQINKALMLGMAVVDGFKAITASLSQSPLAIGPAPNPAGIASLAAAITTTAANIAKIAAQQYKPSGGGAGGAAATPPSISGGGGGNAGGGASFNPPQFFGIGQGGQANGQNINISPKVSVVEINQKQESVKVSESRGTEKLSTE